MIDRYDWDVGASTLGAMMTGLIRRALMVVAFLHLTAAIASATLRDDVERLVRGATLRTATIAVSIRDADSGAALVSVNAEAPMIPASNMKLITTGAALHALGPSFEFGTKLMRDGDRLIVVGDGDPAFGDPELLPLMVGPEGQSLDVEAFIGLWVKPLVESGVAAIDEIVVDDRIFDREFVHCSWPVDQLNRSYCAQVSGFNFHANVLHFYPRPRPNQPPLITDCRPLAPWLKIINDATSREGTNDKSDVWIARKLNSNEMTFKGNVRFAYRAPVPVTVHDMPEVFAQILADRLRSAGIQVDMARVANHGDPIAAGVLVGPVVTTPISTVLTRCNRDSENLYAECLLKRIGHGLTGEPGSWMNGAAIARHIVHERLNDPKLAGGVLVADGSGLSQDNRVTAALMTAWLRSFHLDSRLGPPFIESLAVAGESGTLQKRYSNANLHGASVQAKTGYINGVSCLSGFVTMPDGRRRTFSVLVNNLRDPATVPAAKMLQDQVVIAIAEDLAQSPVASAMPSN